MTSGEALADVAAPRPVVASHTSFAGRVWDVVTDTVDLGEGGVVTRDYVRHTGAVSVMALNEHSELFLIRQYRHPVRRELWEPPAGLLDVSGEPALEAAKRELWEEADLRADTWHTLLDFFTTPGGVSERIRIFLARDLHEVPAEERFSREGEELGMPSAWVPVADVLQGIAAGRLGCPTLVAGAFALDLAMRSQWSTLRAADAPFSQ